ncbi:MAG: type II secretion system protein [Alphaproteobacteria bacterium]
MKNKAFSLTELSVSLVIIGLILGGITSINYVRKRYNLLAIMDDFNKLNNAYLSFKDIYQAIPGDMASYSVPTFGTGVKYGNGNNLIDNLTNSAGDYEGVIALQHLASANLITGNFSGTWNISQNNLPYYPSKSYSYNGYYFGSTSTNPGVFTITAPTTNSKNDSIVIYSKIIDSNNDGVIAPSTEARLNVITPMDAYKLDLKFDDGYPMLGNIIASGGTDVVAVCADYIGGTIAYTYKTSAIGVGCLLALILDRKSN